MVPATIVLFGSLSIDSRGIGAAADVFGWSVQRAPNLRVLSEIADARAPLVVLFGVKGGDFSWRETLKGILDTAPEAFPIACHGSEIIPWPDMADAGAFHAIGLPLHQTEVRQSLGFVWAALQHQAGKVFLVRRPAATRIDTLSAKAARGSGAA